MEFGSSLVCFVSSREARRVVGEWKPLPTRTGKSFVENRMRRTSITYDTGYAMAARFGRADRC